MQTRMIIVAALVLASVPACKKSGGDAGHTAAESPTIELAPEDYVVAARGELQTGPRISGTLQAANRAVVRAETQGAIVAIGPELGQSVKKGELLARIESKALGDVTSSAKSGLMSAEAQFDLAMREVKRTEALVKGGALAQRELDRAQSQLKAAEATVTQARAQLSSSKSQLGDATARSPLDGVIARRAVSAGDVVSPGTELYEVIEPSTMRLEASVASDDLAAIKVGTEVDFTVRGYPGQRFVGTIARVAPAADPVTRQIQILVDIPNPGGKLVAGLYAEGRVSAEKREGLLLPTAAVEMSGDQPSVLRASKGVVERVAVGLGVRDERAEAVEVTNGLAPGDIVVLLHATKNVAAGSKVQVLPKAAAPPPAGSGSAAPQGSGSAAPQGSGSAAAPRGSGSAGAPDGVSP